MLSATNHDGPTFHTRSRTAQINTTDNLTPQPKTDTATPDITNVTDTPNAMPKLITKERLQTLQQMQRTDPFCKCISKHLSNSRALKHEVDLFLHMKGLLYKEVMDSNQKFWLLSYQNHGNRQCLLKHMTNLVTREQLIHTAS